MDAKKQGRGVVVAILMTAAIGFVGCGGAGQSENTKKAADKTAGTLDDIGRALDKAAPGGQAGLVLKGGGKNEAISESVSCGPSGSVSVSGDVSETEATGSLDLDLTFNGCEGVNGKLDIFGSYTETSLDMTIDGSVEDSECKMVFSQLNFKMTVAEGEMSALEAEDDNEIPSNVAITGSVSVTCGGKTFSCGQSGDEIICDESEDENEEEEVEDDEDDEDGNEDEEDKDEGDEDNDDEE